MIKPNSCLWKKENLNCGLYLAHLSTAQEGGKTCYVIENYINKAVNEELKRKCRTVDEKLKKLSNIQIDKPDNIENFYLHIINKTDIVFYPHEISLFDKGLK